MNQVPDMDDLFQDCDVIVPTPRNLLGGVRGHYDAYHNVEDLDLVGEIIKEKYPSYVNAYINTMDGHLLLPWNMFVMRKEDFNEYAEFVFGVLKEFDARMGFNTDDDVRKHVEEHTEKYLKKFSPNDDVTYQMRIGGFLGERLFSCFVRKHFKKPHPFNVEVTQEKYNGWNETKKLPTSTLSSDIDEEMDKRNITIIDIGKEVKDE